MKLAGQPLQILERLLQRSGHVVTREELRSELWPADTFVDFEHNLNSAVKRLRAALGDSADTPRFIETLPRRGYRFLVPVESVPDLAPSAAVPETPPPSEAVLPVEAAPPPARGVSMRRAASIAAVGASLMVLLWTLDVALILEGSVTRSGDRIRVTAQLIDAATDRHLWAETYTGPIGDLLSFQAQVARAVAREVHVTLSPPEEARLAQVRRVDPAVQEAFLKARYFWNQRTAKGLSQSIEYFSQAVTLDPTYAPARAGLADAYNLLPRYGSEPTRRALAQAKAHAITALSLDPALAQAHAALAKVQHSLDWNWDGSERSFLKAIELSPGYATAHHWYSVFLLTVGRVDEGIEEARRARELDPLSPVINLHLAYSLSYADRLDDAEKSIERALELEPRYANAHYLSGWVHLRRGDAEASRAAFRTAIELTGNPREYLEGLAAAEVASGREAEARRILAELEATRTTAEVSGQPLVWALVALGRTDDAFRILETDFENRSVCFYLFDLVNHWFLEPLRADRRLQADTSGLSLVDGAERTDATQ